MCEHDTRTMFTGIKVLVFYVRSIWWQRAYGGLILLLREVIYLPQPPAWASGCTPANIKSSIVFLSVSRALPFELTQIRQVSSGLGRGENRCWVNDSISWGNCKASTEEGGGFKVSPMMCWRNAGMLCVVVARCAEPNAACVAFRLALPLMSYY